MPACAMRWPNHRHVGEVRGEGMIAAVEFVADRDDRVFFDPARKIGVQLAAAMLERGVIARAMPQGDILGFCPSALPDRGRKPIPSSPPPQAPWKRYSIADEGERAGVGAEPGPALRQR